MFESDRFIQDCRDGLGEQNAHAALREIVARAVSEPGQILIRDIDDSERPVGAGHDSVPA